MMFSAFPRRMRIMIRVALATAWIMVAAGAAANLILAPIDALRDVASSVVVSAASLAAAGVVTNRYRWEWVAAWFAAAGLVPHILLAWYAVPANLGRMQNAFLLTGLCMFFVVRALMCAAHAAKLRRLPLQPEVGGGE